MNNTARRINNDPNVTSDKLNQEELYILNQEKEKKVYERGG